jgi:fatty acid desaturase
VLLEMQSYRAGHLKHHTFLGDALRDSERRVWLNLRGLRIVRLFLEHLSGWRFASALLRYAPRDESGARPSLLRYGGSVALTNGALFAYCTWLGAPLLYFGLWLHPLVSVGLFLVSLLAIVQHQTEAYAALGEDRPDWSFAPPLTRTSVGASLAERILLAPIGAVWHHEHHLLPGVPHTRLRTLHRLLRERGFYEERPEERVDSYVGVLGHLVAPAAEPGPR